MLEWPWKGTMNALFLVIFTQCFLSVLSAHLSHSTVSASSSVFSAANFFVFMYVFCWAPSVPLRWQERSFTWARWVNFQWEQAQEQDRHTFLRLCLCTWSKFLESILFFWGTNTRVRKRRAATSHAKAKSTFMLHPWTAFIFLGPINWLLVSH